MKSSREDLIDRIEKALFYFEMGNIGNVAGADCVEFMDNDWCLAINLLSESLDELKKGNISDIDFIICNFLDKHNKDFDLFICICEEYRIQTEFGVEENERLTIKKLMKKYDLKKSSMYRYMKKLLSDGLIEKHIFLDNDNNERAYFIPSEKGLNVYKIIKEYI